MTSPPPPRQPQPPQSILASTWATVLTYGALLSNIAATHVAQYGALPSNTAATQVANPPPIQGTDIPVQRSQGGIIREIWHLYGWNSGTRAAGDGVALPSNTAATHVANPPPIQGTDIPVQRAQGGIIREIWHLYGWNSGTSAAGDGVAQGSNSGFLGTLLTRVSGELTDGRVAHGWSSAVNFLTGVWNRTTGGDELGTVKNMASLFIILQIMVLGAIVVVSSELRCRSQWAFLCFTLLGGLSYLVTISEATVQFFRKRAQIRQRKIIAFWAILFASIGFWISLIVWIVIVTSKKYCKV